MNAQGPTYSEWLGRLLAWVAGLLGLIALFMAGLIRPGDLTEEGANRLLASSPIPLVVWLSLLLLGFLVSGGVAFFFLRRTELQIATLRDERREFERVSRDARYDLEQELRVAKNALAHTDHLMVTDPITGIPNFRSWKRHAEAWPQSESSRKPSSLILIDLDRLGWLNETSHECANRVLEYFATNTYDAMRRNEHAFKVPDKNGAHQPTEMFRHYAGGDEFIFHLSDDVYGALGFLGRLNRECSRYEQEIKQMILHDYMEEREIEKYRLQFCAAIVPIQPGISPERLIEPGLNMLMAAKKDSTTRVLLQRDRKPQRTLPEFLSELQSDGAALEEALVLIEVDEPSAKEQREGLSRQLRGIQRTIESITIVEQSFRRAGVKGNHDSTDIRQ